MRPCWPCSVHALSLYMRIPSKGVRNVGQYITGAFRFTAAEGRGVFGDQVIRHALGVLRSIEGQKNIQRHRGNKRWVDGNAGRACPDRWPVPGDTFVLGTAPWRWGKAPGSRRNGNCSSGGGCWR